VPKWRGVWLAIVPAFRGNRPWRSRMRMGSSLQPHGMV
jgi:hypothetical protein